MKKNIPTISTNDKAIQNISTLEENLIKEDYSSLYRIVK